MTAALDLGCLSALFSRVLAGAPVPIVLLDRSRPDPRIVFASDGFERLTGYAGGEAIGHSLRLLEGPETASSAAGELASALREERNARIVIRHHRRDRSAFWDEVYLSPIRNPDGLVSHVICVHMDVSKQIESEEALCESLRLVSTAKREWECAVDSLPELVLFVDGDMRVMRANRTVEAWGLGAVLTIRGRHLHDVLHPHCLLAPCYLLDLWDRLRGSEGDSDAVDCNTKDEILGRRVHLTMRISRVSGPSPGFDSVIVIVRDVGDVHDREEIRRRRDRFEAMGFLVGGLAHEIGNPLAAMKTTLEVWSRGFDAFDGETHRRYLRRMGEGVDRLQASVERILGRRNGEARTDQVVHVAPLLERTRRLFEDDAARKKIALGVEPSLRSDAAVLGDEAAIDEVLANLAKNAIEACRSGDRISIDARLQEEGLIIQVRDSGPGIARSDMEHLFVPFFTTKPTGTGLGLAHVHRLMDEMGGRVEIESMEGGGTVATLRFRRTSGERADWGT